jgi:sugar lactone lactonase YvrE
MSRASENKLFNAPSSIFQRALFFALVILSLHRTHAQPFTGVTTLAGSSGNVQFSTPCGVAADSAGNVYVADTQNHTIRLVTPTGVTITLAGSNGVPGTADGPVLSARFNGPEGPAVDAAGNLYVADTGNNTIRKITLDGSVSTLAGLAGASGSDDGVGANARFSQPRGVAADSAGNIYVADTGNNAIRKIAPDGTVTTLAGQPSDFGSEDGSTNNARFNGPFALALDGANNLYVSDYFNHAVRKVTPAGDVTTIAGMAGVWGSADGTNADARFFGPQGIAVDSAGPIYVLDSGNHTLRQVAAVGTNWAITTLAGLATISGSADGPGGIARFFFPAALAGGSPNQLYLADAGNNTLRLVSVFTNASPSIVFQPQSQTVNPGGSAALSVTAVGVPPLSYQWLFNSTNIPGATASAYTRLNIQSGDVGFYSVQVANAYGAVLSSNAFLALPSAPLILVQPQDQNVLIGQTTAFSVVAAGAQPLTYQWRFNGNNIPGATSSAFAIHAASSANSGSYSVVVTNSLGVAVSSDAVLGLLVVAAWGDNTWGQTAVPPNAANIISISAGAAHTLALRAEGRVLAWGDDTQGQSDVPASLTDALAVAAGGYHNLVIRANGTVVAWGANDAGQTNVPSGLANVIAIAAGALHSLALRADETITCWGDNSWGQTNLPPGLANVIAIAAGGNHCLALKADGTVIAWGDNTDAYGNFAGQSVVPPGLTNIIAIAAGDYYSLALRADRTVAAWGDNSQGQCTIPSGLTNVAALAAGGAHSLALRANGTVAAWGLDWNGQCDLPSTLTNIVAVAGGETHTVVLFAGALPKPLLLHPARTATTFTALAQTLNRRTYVLESIANLAATNWNPVSTLPGNGALRLLTDPAATGSHRFYRLRQF